MIVTTVITQAYCSNCGHVWKLMDGLSASICPACGSSKDGKSSWERVKP